MNVRFIDKSRIVVDNVVYVRASRICCVDGVFFKVNKHGELLRPALPVTITSSGRGRRQQDGRALLTYGAPDARGRQRVWIAQRTTTPE